MIDKYLASKQSSIRRSLASLRDSFSKSGVSASDALQFVFLCGANQRPGVPSARRAALAQFAKRALPHARFFYAETLFQELQHIGPTKNLLDIETEISKLADHILIVLESSSAFCELGAFAHRSLRDKLIVINDEQYKNADSFIRNGPLKAIEENGGNDRLLHYKMSSFGVTRKDAIGTVFADVFKVLNKTGPRTTTKLSLSDCHPQVNDRRSIQFLHDVVLFCGPIKHREIIKVIEFLFGTGKYDSVKHQLSLLRACEIVRSSKHTTTASPPSFLYSSTQSHPFLKYDIDWLEILASFKTTYLKSDPNRFA